MHTQFTIARIALSLYYSERRIESPPRVAIYEPTQRVGIVKTYATNYVSCPLEGVDQ